MSALDWPTIMTALQHWVVAGSGLPADHVIWKYGKVARPTNDGVFIELSVFDMRQVAHDYVVKENNPLVFSAQTATIDVAGNRFVVPGHPFVTGDGSVNVLAGTAPSPFALSTSYWVIVLDANHVQLADSFKHAMQNQPLVLTDAGAGTIQLVRTTFCVRAGQEIKRTALGIRECTIELQAFAPEGTVYLAQAALTDVIASLSLHVDELLAAGIGCTDLGVAYINGGVRLLEGHRGSILEPRAICEITVYLGTLLQDTIGRVDSVSVTVKPSTDAGPLPQITLDMESPNE